MGRDPKQAQLLWELETEGFGGHELLVSDLDGDGRPELVVRQGPGQMRSDLYEDRGWNTDGERHLHCITAVDLEGRRLWQVGEPHRREDPFCSHGCKDFTAADLDGDGRPEVLAIDWDTLKVYDGLSGAVVTERRLPTDNFAVVMAGALRGDRSRHQVLVKVNDAPYPPYEYGNPTLVLDSDLSELWMTPHYSGSGHSPVLLDVDEDGCDEILIGYNLVDHDGRIVWTIPVENATAEHADHIYPVDLDGDGRMEIAYAGSRDFFVADTEGAVIWRRPHAHSQNSVAGRLRDDVDGLALVLNEKWIGMTCYTADGRKLWSREGVGYARHRVSGWKADGLDLLVYQPHLKREQEEVPYGSVPGDTRLYWPYLIDGNGERAAELPWKVDYEQPSQRIRGARAYDYGIGFQIQVIDLDEDGRDEVIVWDRQRILAFGAPA